MQDITGDVNKAKSRSVDVLATSFYKQGKRSKRKHTHISEMVRKISFKIPRKKYRYRPMPCLKLRLQHERTPRPTKKTHSPPAQWPLRKQKPRPPQAHQKTSSCPPHQPRHHPWRTRTSSGAPRRLLRTPRKTPAPRKVHTPTKISVK